MTTETQQYIDELIAEADGVFESEEILIELADKLKLEEARLECIANTFAMIDEDLYEAMHNDCFDLAYKAGEAAKTIRANAKHIADDIESAEVHYLRLGLGRIY